MKVQIIISILIIGLLSLFTSCSDSGLEPSVVTPTEEEGNNGETETGGTETEELPTAPDFSITTFDNQELKLEDYAGKVLVIWFFGSECPPCIAIGGTVEKDLNESFSDKTDYAIIGIDQWDRNNATVEGFKTKTGVEFPLGAMGSGVAKEYGTTFDRLIVINKEGKIAYKAESRANSTLEDVISVVNELTG